MARFRSDAALCEFGAGFVCSANQRAQWPNEASHVHDRRASSRVPRRARMRAVCYIAARRFARAAGYRLVSANGMVARPQPAAARGPRMWWRCSRRVWAVRGVRDRAAASRLVAARVRTRRTRRQAGLCEATPPGLRSVGTKKPGKLTFSRIFVTVKLVGETGFEPATSTSRT